MMRWSWMVALLGATAAEVRAATPISELAWANGWRSNYASARAEAARLAKPLMVVFRCEP